MRQSYFVQVSVMNVKQASPNPHYQTSSCRTSVGLCPLFHLESKLPDWRECHFIQADYVPTVIERGNLENRDRNDNTSERRIDSRSVV
jgi:hypothetical protein